MTTTDLIEHLEHLLRTAEAIVRNGLDNYPGAYGYLSTSVGYIIEDLQAVASCRKS